MESAYSLKIRPYQHVDILTSFSDGLQHKCSPQSRDAEVTLLLNEQNHAGGPQCMHMSCIVMTIPVNGIKASYCRAEAYLFTTSAIDTIPVGDKIEIVNFNNPANQHAVKYMKAIWKKAL